jgi:hypothetical protein
MKNHEKPNPCDIHVTSAAKVRVYSLGRNACGPGATPEL